MGNSSPKVAGLGRSKREKKSFLCLNANVGALGIIHPRWVVSTLYIVDSIRDWL